MNDSCLAAPASARDETVTLEQLAACIDDTAQAVDRLVDAVLAQDSAGHAAQQAQAELQREVAQLRHRTEEIATALATDRACRDFAHASRLHPKSPIVVYASTFYLGDNVKYAWLDHRQRAATDGIEVWFLPQTPHQEREVAAAGFPVLPAHAAHWSDSHIRVALSAAVVVTSDHFLHPNPYAPALLAGARHVQLWHGVSIKEIGLRNLGHGGNLGPQLARVLATCGPFACLTGTSTNAEPEWRRWFRFERYACVGYPRNDVLYREPTDDDLLNVDLTAYECARRAREAGRRVLLYAPTFRDARPGVWLQDAGLERLADSAASRGDVLIVNVHPVEQPLMPMLLEKFPRVLFVAPGSDVYPLLRLTSALITDYSSMMFDYLHLERPVVLYRPDDEAYRTRSRTLMDAKIEGCEPGPLVFDPQSLDAVLARRDLGQDAQHAQARRTLLERLFDHRDGRSAERLWSLLLEEVRHACSH